jgi:hypothetical protein
MQTLTLRLPGWMGELAFARDWGFPLMGRI